MKKHVLFIGIDISKKWIDVALTTDGQFNGMIHQQFSNTPKGYEKMMNWITQSLKALELKGSWLFGMEHTGVYTLSLCRYLQQAQQDFVLESALRIQRSLGLTRGKDDRADAKAIARYLFLHRKELKPSSLPTQALMDIKDLLAHRSRLIKQRQALKVSTHEAQPHCLPNAAMHWIKEDSDKLILLLSQKIKQVESRMRLIVKQNPSLGKLYELICSVKGVGLITALQIIVHTNGFKAFKSARQFACYIGIAPFHRKSGTSINRPAKVSRLGHSKLKALLTNCVMSAIQNDKELKAYYRRKLAQGKLKYKVFNAVKNKLVARIFATVKRGTPYVELLNYA